MQPCFPAECEQCQQGARIFRATLSSFWPIQKTAIKEPIYVATPKKIENKTLLKIAVKYLLTHSLTHLLYIYTHMFLCFSGVAKKLSTNDPSD